MPEQGALIVYHFIGQTLQISGAINMVYNILRESAGRGGWPTHSFTFCDERELDELGRENRAREAFEAFEDELR